MADKRLIIIGAGGFAIDIADMALPHLGQGQFTSIGGFLDNRPEIDAANLPFPLLGDPDAYAPQPNDLFFIGLGNPQARMHYAELFAAKGARFATLISPKAEVSSSARFAEGCLVSVLSTVGANTQLGAHSFVSTLASLGHDVTVGAYCQISSFCFLGGHSILEDEVVMNPSSTLTRALRVGEGATLGAGSVVLQNVKAGSTVFGVPALPVK